MGKERGSAFLTISVAIVITGNLIGAGILALPVNTGLAGLVPSLIGMVVCGGLMYLSATVLSEEVAASGDESFNLPSFFGKYLGSGGRWVAIAANLIILYGLLTAYLTGGASIIVNLLGMEGGAPLVTTLFFLALTAFTLMGIEIIRKYGSLLMVILWGTFAVMIVLAEPSVEPARFAYMDWGFLPATVPIIVTAFHFHNIIPNVCSSLDWDMGRIRRAIALGMVIGFVMNALWVHVGIGALPLTGDGSLTAAFEQNTPATVPMSQVIASPVFLFCSLLFSLLAIVTSYAANGMGMVGFAGDLLGNVLHLKSRLAVVLFAFLPPYLVAMVYPDVFLAAMNVVGGVGIVTLFGVLPGVILLRRAASAGTRVVALAMVVLFALFLCIEVGQEFGLLKLHPRTEHWHHHEQPVTPQDAQPSPAAGDAD